MTTQMAKAGAVACFGLTVQFVATLALAAVAFEGQGFSGIAELPEQMARYIGAHEAAPLSFIVLNFYNASFAITAVVVILASQELLGELAPLRMRMAVIAIIMAGTLFLATGVIPVVTGPQILKANDASALRLLTGILIGMDFAGTSAAGWGVLLGGCAGLTTRLLPRGLSYLLMLGGAVEIVEFVIPPSFILDASLGALWSIWLGAVFLARAKR